MKGFEYFDITICIIAITLDKKNLKKLQSLYSSEWVRVAWPIYEIRRGSYYYYYYSYKLKKLKFIICFSLSTSSLT
jgi:hypothetical protein